MNIILTGSLGHITKPLAQELVQRGHAVTVVSRQPDKQLDIEALGASAAIGSLEDITFLTTTFTGADAVYCMIPPGNFFDPTYTPAQFGQKMGRIYAQAIRESGVRRVVALSSWGRS